MKCIDTIKDGENIIKYKLEGSNGKSMLIKPSQLKYAIMHNQIVVSNLGIDSNGNLYIKKSGREKAKTASSMAKLFNIKITIRYYDNKIWRPREYTCSIQDCVIIPVSDDTASVIDSMKGQLTDGIWENSRKSYSEAVSLHYCAEAKAICVPKHFRLNKWGSDETAIRKYIARRIKQVAKQEFVDEGLDPIANWNRSNQYILCYLNDATVAEVYKAYDEVLKRKER